MVFSILVFQDATFQAEISLDVCSPLALAQYKILFPPKSLVFLWDNVNTSMYNSDVCFFHLDLQMMMCISRTEKEKTFKMSTINCLVKTYLFSGIVLESILCHSLSLPIQCLSHFLSLPPRASSRIPAECPPFLMTLCLKSYSSPSRAADNRHHR